MNRGLRLLIVSFLLLSGCAGQPQPSVITTSPAGPVDVTITTVEVVETLAKPMDVRVIIKGTLPDSCAQIGKETVERDGHLFSVDLPAARQSTLGCDSQSVSFERVVALSMDPNGDQVSGHYAVLVNGFMQKFDLQGTQMAVSPVSSNAIVKAVQPTPTEAAAVAPTSANTTQDNSSAAEKQPIAVTAPVVDKVSLGPSTGPAKCINKAAFFEDVTIPPGTSLDPGTAFTKTWKVRNEGTCVWGSGYFLKNVDGDGAGSLVSVPLPQAAPNDVVQISVPVTAPSLPGTYQSDWGFATPEGQYFGVGSAGLYPLQMKYGVRQPALVGVGCEVVYDHDIEFQILELINSERAMRGLPPHALDEDLSKVARAHSTERGCIGVHSHLGADGKNYESRVKRANIEYKWINEIIYWGNYGPKSAVQWWVYQSQLHHDIVMAEKYTTIGVGYAKTSRGENKEYFTVLFMTPP